MSYAIDFGTTNTVVTRWNGATHQGEFVALPPLAQVLADNPPLIPSVVYVENGAEGKVIIGQAVFDQGRDNGQDQRFFRTLKRGIGATVQGFLPQLDGQSLTCEQLGQWYLQNVITAIAAQDPQGLNQLVLTVPVDSFEAYRHWLSQTCQSWGVSEIRLLDEPTAAALGYNLGTARQVLVLDFGGGTVDFAWVQLNTSPDRKPGGFLLSWGQRRTDRRSPSDASPAKVMAKAGMNLGGSDIDHWIVQHFVQTLGLTPSALVYRLAERLKIQLTTQETATEAFFDDQALETYELTLTRPELGEILHRHHWFDRLGELWQGVRQTAQGQGLQLSDLDGILVVGGTSQLPLIQDWILTQFPQKLVHYDQPFGAIALGALQLYQGRQVEDYLYHSYGVRYWNRRKSCHNWHPIIKSGQPYPMAEPVELTLGASLDNQPSIELIVGELGSTVGATEVYFDGQQFVTRVLSREDFTVYPLNDRDGARQIAQLSPPGKPGSDRLKVQFWVDENRYLRLTVEDLLQNTRLLDNQRVAQLH